MTRLLVLRKLWKNNTRHLFEIKKTQTSIQISFHRKNENKRISLPRTQHCPHEEKTKIYSQRRSKSRDWEEANFSTKGKDLQHNKSCTNQTKYSHLKKNDLWNRFLHQMWLNLVWSMENNYAKPCAPAIQIIITSKQELPDSSVLFWFKADIPCFGILKENLERIGKKQRTKAL